MFVRVAWVGVVALVGASAAGADDVRFNRDVRAILADHCWNCHGPAGKKGGLRLDERESAIKPAKSGDVAIVPGHPDKSQLLVRIFSKDESEVMPPPSTRKTLTDAQKATLKRWIAEGAKFEKHWAFEPPARTPTPKHESPRVRGPIDAFVLARLRQEKLDFGPDADRETLARRAAFALTGLPPTLADLDRFLGDASPKAYEAYVDRLMATPAFGEEMARHWLDVARYGDTHGLHLDNERQMWLYRDWVVNAFNTNLPYDVFLRDQIAGDLVPNATEENQIATGFARCNVSTSEGGSIESEWVFRNAVDRTSTAAQAFLGLTAGCSVCHDHKFDPLTSKDFYSLYAFFLSSAGPALDGNKLLTDPVLKVGSPEIAKKVAETNKRIGDLNQQAQKAVAGFKYEEPKQPTKNVKASMLAWIAVKGGDEAKNYPVDIVRTLQNASQNGKVAGPAQKKLSDYYIQHVWVESRKTFDPINQQIAKLTKERDQFEAQAPSTFVFKEMPKPREAFVMMRGQYDKKGAKVEPDTPSFLPPLKKADARATRLDLAAWMTSPENPLTARVAVNRLWQQIFGVGLVRTSGDFGTQGELPSHPELLDALALSFREGGWDVKTLVRAMVTSTAFRQSSRASEDLVRRDPENRLLARGPRFRLDAEQLRDNALAVSGLLDARRGGKGVNPYQPPNIWEPVAFVGSNTQFYRQSKGADLYRRSLYTFIKRTAPPPFLTNFDAPNREQLCERRVRTNTPLQALQLLNDVQHFEAARGLAQRTLAQGGTSASERIVYAYRVVLGRRPDAGEAAIAQRALDRFLARYRADRDAAKAAVRVGESPVPAGIDEVELAAYTLFGNLLLNLDETVTRN